MRIKKYSFFFFTVLLCIVSLEFFSCVGNAILARGLAERPRESWARGQEIPEWMKPEVIHPYVGFVMLPSDKDPRVGEYGFFGAKPSLQSRSSQKIIIGIFGGSVAADFSGSGVEDLQGALKKNPFFLNKELSF